MSNVQQWLNQKHPKETRSQLAELNISNQSLEGVLTLGLKDFSNLEELNCSNNQITRIFLETYGRTRSAKKQKLTWKIKKLDISNNNFVEKDLSFLEELTELEELSVANNRFFGSLEPLKGLTKLRKLNISNTDIDSGLEYLPDSLEEINCSTEKRKDAKVKSIEQVLKDCRVDKSEKNEWWKINLNELQKNLLLLAVKENKIGGAKSAIEKLKELGEDVTHIVNNFRDGRYKLTLLHIATAKDYPEMAKLLLEVGANPNTQDLESNTPLHFAAEKNNLEVLKLLKDHGGSVDAVNNYNWSVLHSAASGIVNEKEDWEIIKWLLKQNANTEVKLNIGTSVRDVFFEKDWSYAEQYDKLLKQINKVNFYQVQK